MTNDADMLVATVDGTELALLVASSFALMGWPFERGQAQALVTKAVRRRADGINQAISEQARKAWRDAGLWDSPTGRWTRDLLQRRALTSTGLRLSREEIEDAILGLRATHAEFSTNWDEFCVATPGNIDWYAATPRSLLDLADKLENALASA